jgi:putative ABC transport system permease protein
MTLQFLLRSFRKNPFFSGINLAGLSIGLAACWLIGLYVLHQYSYDTFLPASDRICAVALDLKMQNEAGKTTNTPPPLGPLLATEFPEVEMAARSFYLRESTVRRANPAQNTEAFAETGVYAVDTAFLELFGFAMTEGDARTALDRPGSVVLSQRAADKHFGSTPAVGQPLLINDRMFTVSGIVQTPPENSTLDFDFLLPISDFKVVERFSWSWVWLQVDTWVRLRQTASPEYVAALEAKFPDLVRRHAPAAFERIGQNFEEQMKKGDRYRVALLPLKSLHLDQPDLSTNSAIADGRQVRMFGLVGLLVLLLACVNYMNLSTARASVRMREVGVRKVLGAHPRSLVRQFLSEAWAMSGAAMILATGLAVAFLPLFNRLTDLSFGVEHLFAWQPMAFAGALALLTGILGGLYPALFFSRFSAAGLFRPATGSLLHSGRGNVRSGLVVLQFAVSIALLLGTWVVLRQLSYARTHSPGLLREHVLVLPVLRNLVRYENEAEKTETFRQQIEQLPGVVSAASTVFLPSVGSFGDFYEPEQGSDPADRPVPTNLLLSSFMGDTHFVPTLGMDIKEGRNFQDDHGLADSCSVLLNEAAVRAIGWEKPIGKWLVYPGNRNQRFQVTGVVRDFHIGSVRGPIEPVAIFHHSSKTYTVWSKYVVARLQPGAASAVVEKIAPLWAGIIPNAPYKYDFLDASFAHLYESDAQVGSVLGVFTGLALFIACLGLLALAAFTAERRTKEISIRKVLGASIAGITGLLAKDFLRLVLLALALAAPVAYYFMQKWLANFSYRVDITWWMFAAAGFATLLIAFLTVGFQSLKAALTNPTEGLRKD